MEGLDLEMATEFLLIAATLIELKLRRLLPEREGVELDEELELLKAHDLLLAKLLECKTFKEAAQMLEQLANRAARSVPRTVGMEERFLNLTPDPLAGLKPVALRDAFLRVLERASAPAPVPGVRLDHVTPIRLTVAEIVGELARVMPIRGAATFRASSRRPWSSGSTSSCTSSPYSSCTSRGGSTSTARELGDLTVRWRPDGPDGPDEGSADPLAWVDLPGDTDLAFDGDDAADHVSVSAGPSLDDVDAYEG